MATYEKIKTSVKNVVTTDSNDTTVVENANPATEKKITMVGKLPLGAHLDWAPITFESFGRTTRVTNDELSRKIYAAFSESFHDLIGANITCTPGGNGGSNFNLELFFEQNTDPRPAGKIENLVNLTSPNGAKGLFAKNQIVQNRVNNKNFTLNDETRMLLSEFMYGGKDHNKYSDAKTWSKWIRQIPIPVRAYSDPFYRNGDRIVICVGGLDLRRVLQKLYGKEMVISTSTSADGTIVNNTATAFYEVRFIKMSQNGNGTFIMNIEQFDKGAVEFYTARENPQMVQNTGIVYYN